MKKIEEMETGELISELDNAGYEMDLSVLKKSTLIGIYSKLDGVTPEEVTSAKKCKESTIASRILEKAEDLEVDLLEKEVLQELVEDKRKTIDSDVQEASEMADDVTPGERIERAQRERVSKGDPDHIEQPVMNVSNEGIVVKFGSVSLKKVDCSDPAVVKQLQDEGKLVGYDGTKKIGYIK